MTENSLYFDLPANLTVKKFIAKLGKQVDLQITTQEYSIKTFYDSFDWRLYNAGMICEFNHSQNLSQLSLVDRKSGHLMAVEEVASVPKFSQQFVDGRFKKSIATVLEMRALLPLCQLPVEVSRINVLNKDQKTVLRLQIDNYELLNNRIHLIPLKGYEKAHKKIVDILQNTLAIKQSTCSVISEALKQQGRKPKDYSSKLAIQLKPEMRADIATKKIFKQLLQAIQINEAGTIDDIDTEFLHDFRVAVRRTRAGLSQIKNTLPVDTVAQYAEFFAWLGQITSPTRDLDVYLLSYQKYQQALPLTLRDDLTPFYAFLKQKQQQAQKELAEHLKSPKYIKQLLAWEQYLNESLAKKAQASQANQAIKQLADIRIWKVYQRVLKEGSAISDKSPAIALHELRKTCKKLRYLMEFFQSLYPQSEIKESIKVLKGFQSVLGDFQDYEVQEISIKEFSQEMMCQKIPSNTLLAMGVLVQYLDTMKCNARNHFAEQFKLFTDAENMRLFKQLFSNKA